MKKSRTAIVHSFLESLYGMLTPERAAQTEKQREQYKTFRAKAREQRGWLERIADVITAFSGSITFAVLHAIWFVTWVLINTGKIPAIAQFDPYPFGLLTMIVSLEAIFLSVFVLISQNRDTQISDLRAELDFHINKQTEQEVTKIITMVHEIHQHLGLQKGKGVDKEVEAMSKHLDSDKIAEQIKKETA
jgi:uncharacterized membrane protein